ncbi:MAG: hypothetical protein ABEJ61_10520 [Haloferacaceae archaeon]
MTLRTSIRRAWRGGRTHPEVLLVGGVVAVLRGVVWAGVALAAPLVLPDVGRYLAPVAALVALVAVRPLSVGVYELVRRPAPESASASLGRAARTVRARYARVLAADAAVGAGVALAAGATAVAWLVVSTGLRYARYAALDPGEPHAMAAVYATAGAATLGALAGSFALRFADAVAAFDGAGPPAACRASVRAARVHPRSLLGFAGLVTGSRATVGLVVGFLAAPATPGGTALARAAGVAAGTVVGTGVAAVHAAHYGSLVAPVAAEASDDASTTRAWPRVRRALVVLLVVGLVVGAAAVRTADVRPRPEPSDSLPDADRPRRVVAVAGTNTAARSHRTALLARNASAPGAGYRPRVRSGVDYGDRQMYVHFAASDGDGAGGYFAEGTYALVRGDGGWWAGGAHRGGDWTTMPLPAWGTARPDPPSRTESVPTPDADWRLVERNASTLVVRASGPAAVRAALEPAAYEGMAAPMAADSRVTAYVDRERGVLDRVTFHLHSRETGEALDYRLEYRDVGTTDVRRPAALGDRGPLELAWDLVYY